MQDGDQRWQGGGAIWLATPTFGLILIVYADRNVVPEHLPLAQTRSSSEEEELLMSRLEELAQRFSSAAAPAPDPQVETTEEGGTA